MRFVGTTDDPPDDLVHHRAIQDHGDLAVAPSSRPDKDFQIESADFQPWIAQLSFLNTGPNDSFAAPVQALVLRLNHFVDQGCRAADHGIERFENGAAWSEGWLNANLRRRLTGEPPTPEKAAAWRTAILTELGRAYAKRDIVLQLHSSPHSRSIGWA